MKRLWMLMISAGMSTASCKRKPPQSAAERRQTEAFALKLQGNEKTLRVSEFGLWEGSMPQLLTPEREFALAPSPAEPGELFPSDAAREWAILIAKEYGQRYQIALLEPARGLLQISDAMRRLHGEEVSLQGRCFGFFHDAISDRIWLELVHASIDTFLDETGYPFEITAAGRLCTDANNSLERVQLRSRYNPPWAALTNLAQLLERYGIIFDPGRRWEVAQVTGGIAPLVLTADFIWKAKAQMMQAVEQSAQHLERFFALQPAPPATAEMVYPGVASPLGLLLGPAPERFAAATYGLASPFRVKRLGARLFLGFPISLSRILGPGFKGSWFNLQEQVMEARDHWSRLRASRPTEEVEVAGVAWRLVSRSGGSLQFALRYEGQEMTLLAHEFSRTSHTKARRRHEALLISEDVGQAYLGTFTTTALQRYVVLELRAAVQRTPARPPEATGAGP